MFTKLKWWVAKIKAWFKSITEPAFVPWGPPNLDPEYKRPPYTITYHRNGNKRSEEWLLNNQLHKDDGGPAFIFYYENGKKEFEEYMVLGKHHREGGKPYIIWYNDDGSVAREEK